jgi:psp operon transcriptional activator
VQAIQQHRWEGNVRELKNVVERAVYQSGGAIIDSIVFNPFNSPHPFAPMNAPEAKIAHTTDRSIPGAELPSERSFKEAIRKTERSLVQRALEATRFNQRQAATHLELSYDQFRGLIRKYPDLVG